MPSARGSARPFPCEGSRPASTRVAPHHYEAAHPHCPHRILPSAGDILRVGVHFLPAGDMSRVGGQESGPRRRRTPPDGMTRTRSRGMSPAEGEDWQHRNRDREPRPAQPRQPGRRRQPSPAPGLRLGPTRRLHPLAPPGGQRRPPGRLRGELGVAASRLQGPGRRRGRRLRRLRHLRPGRVRPEGHRPHQVRHQGGLPGRHRGPARGRHQRRGGHRPQPPHGRGRHRGRARHARRSPRPHAHHW